MIFPKLKLLAFMAFMCCSIASSLLAAEPKSPIRNVLLIISDDQGWRDYGFMGHADITTTRDFYLQSADANEREAAARYEALMGDGGNETCVGLAFSGDEDKVRRNVTPVSDSPTTGYAFGATGFEPATS